MIISKKNKNIRKFFKNREFVAYYTISADFVTISKVDGKAFDSIGVETLMVFKHDFEFYPTTKIWEFLTENLGEDLGTEMLAQIEKDLGIYNGKELVIFS